MRFFLVCANLHNPKSKTPHLGLNLINPAVTEADMIFHEAAKVSVAQSIADPTESHEMNNDLILTILEAARDTDTRAIFASSAAIYGYPNRSRLMNHTQRSRHHPMGLKNSLSINTAGSITTAMMLKQSRSALSTSRPATTGW